MLENSWSLIKDDSILTYNFRLPKRQIGLVRFILEGYDGLGTQTTSPNSEIVTWIIPCSRQEEAEDLLIDILKHYS
jgi:Domain of unknown function (DUF4911)